jgi:hypothetical protein
MTIAQMKQLTKQLELMFNAAKEKFRCEANKLIKEKLHCPENKIDKVLSYSVPYPSKYGGKANVLEFTIVDDPSQTKYFIDISCHKAVYTNMLEWENISKEASFNAHVDKAIRVLNDQYNSMLCALWMAEPKYRSQAMSMLKNFVTDLEDDAQILAEKTWADSLTEILSNTC